MASTKKEETQFVKSLKSKEIDEVKELVDGLLQLTGVDYSLDLNFENDSETLFINIDSQKSLGLLIGSRGRTLQALQTLIAAIVRNKMEMFVRIAVNVGDWREKEYARLESLANKTAERAVSLNQKQMLYNLTPAERRIVHTILSENDTVDTESEGEGRERYLVVKPKNA